MVMMLVEQGKKFELWSELRWERSACESCLAEEWPKEDDLLPKLRSFSS